MNAFIITLSIFRTIFSWCLPLCVLCVIIADYREVRRSNMTLAALRRHKESLAHYHIMSILMLCVTCITYWVVAGSPADMFFLSSYETNTPYFSVGLPQTGFPARMLLLPTFAVFISMMMLGFWSAAIGNGSKIGLYGLGSCLGAFVLTVLVLVWGEIGTRQHVRCERFCPAGQECGCGSFWHITLPLVIIEFALILVHGGLTARVWKRVRGYASLDEKNVDVDMEAPEDRQETFADDQQRLPQGTDSAAAYY